MTGYDAEFASKKKRKSIDLKNKSECRVCLGSKVDTASQFEWPCLIIEDWICETHCTEAKLKDFSETHALIRGMAKNDLAVSFNSNEDLLSICKRCPYYNF